MQLCTPRQIAVYRTQHSFISPSFTKLYVEGAATIDSLDSFRQSLSFAEYKFALVLADSRSSTPST